MHLKQTGGSTDTDRTRSS